MKVGDRITCWSEKETTRKMMELASKGIIADVVKDKNNCLVIRSMPKEDSNET